MFEDEDIMPKVLAAEIDNRIQLERRVNQLEGRLRGINDLITNAKLKEIDIWSAIEGNEEVIIATDVLKQIQELSDV